MADDIVKYWWKFTLLWGQGFLHKLYYLSDVNILFHLLINVWNISERSKYPPNLAQHRSLQRVNIYYVFNMYMKYFCFIGRQIFLNISVSFTNIQTQQNINMNYRSYMIRNNGRIVIFKNIFVYELYVISPRDRCLRHWRKVQYSSQPAWDKYDIPPNDHFNCIFIYKILNLFDW